MTTDEIAKRLLSALKEENRKSWTFKQGQATSRLQIIFQSTVPSFLEIKDIGERFDGLFDICWRSRQDEYGPCVVFEGRIDAKHLQAIFVVKESEN